jgi:ribose transport system substrate-binding protein
MSGRLIGDAWRRACARQETRRIVVAGLLTAATAISLAACGSSSSSSSSPAASAASSASTASSPSTTSASGANVATAQAAVDRWSGHPSPFPVSEPLKKPISSGTTIAYLQASDPIGALIGQLLKPGVQALGAKYVAINAGSTASAAQAAASSALALKPAALIIPAFLPSEFGGKLQELKAAGVKLIGSGMTGWKQYGIDYCVNCEAYSSLVGKLLADWAVAKQGSHANAAFYSVPELSFTAPMWESFETEMNKQCPNCQVRNVPVGVATIGSTAPKTIVTDLQSHAGTNAAVFSTMDMAQGLPAAMKSAGITNVATVGGAATPENLQDIKAGNLTAGVGVDFPTYVWEMVDVAARLSLGQQPPASETIAPLQFLEQKDITFDPSKGYVGYPDFAQRYGKLWHP